MKEPESSEPLKSMDSRIASTNTWYVELDADLRVDKISYTLAIGEGPLLVESKLRIAWSKEAIPPFTLNLLYTTI